MGQLLINSDMNSLLSYFFYPNLFTGLQMSQTNETKNIFKEKKMWIQTTNFERRLQPAFFRLMDLRMIKYMKEKKNFEQGYYISTATYQMAQKSLQFIKSSLAGSRLCDGVWGGGRGSPLNFFSRSHVVLLCCTIM